MVVSFVHVADERSGLQDAFRQPGLAQPMLAMQILTEEIAKRVAHEGLLFRFVAKNGKVSTIWTKKVIDLDSHVAA